MLRIKDKGGRRAILFCYIRKNYYKLQMNIFSKEVISNFLSVAAGVLTSFFLGAVLLYLSSYFLINSSGLIPSLLFITIGIFIPCFSGGLVCGYLSTRKDYTYIFITSLISIFLVGLNNDFKFKVATHKILLLFALIVAFTLIGGAVGYKLKNQLRK